MALSLSVLTLNIWGIPFISKDKDARVKAIAEKLASGTEPYDIISLQEVWSEYDFKRIKERIIDQFPYSHYFYSGVVGSGLCVFSRHKILSVFFHRWSLNGYIHKIQHGDWFGGKGVGLCKIMFNEHIINFYIAHLHAEYDKNCDQYMTHRLVQAFDTAQFLETTRGDCSLQILAGDLNTEPEDLAYRILMSTSKMKDSFKQKTSKFPGTHEYVYNTYTSGEISGKKSEGIRIDYILYRDCSHCGWNCEVEHYELPLLDKIPELNISYSDHEAVHTIFSLVKKQRESFNGIDRAAMQENIKDLKECVITCNNSLKALDSHRRYYSMVAIALVVLLFNIVEIEPAYYFRIAFMGFKFMFVCLIIFLIFMATLWNTMERHGILAGKLAMEIALRNSQDVLKDIDY